MVAQQELAELIEARHPARDVKLEQSASALAVALERGVDLEDGWQAWRLGLTPTRSAGHIMGVPLEAVQP